jgi:hypothetical protein
MLQLFFSYLLVLEACCAGEGQVRPTDATNECKLSRGSGILTFSGM